MEYCPLTEVCIFIEVPSNEHLGAVMGVSEPFRVKGGWGHGLRCIPDVPEIRPRISIDETERNRVAVPVQEDSQKKEGY